jgi:hypothetical protein
LRLGIDDEEFIDDAIKRANMRAYEVVEVPELADRMAKPDDVLEKEFHRLWETMNDDARASTVIDGH